MGLEKRIECNGVNNYFDVANTPYCVYALSNKVSCEYLEDNKSKKCNYDGKYRLPIIIIEHKQY